jgi:hypothetical protein
MTKNVLASVYSPMRALLFLIASALAMNPQQASVARQIMKQLDAPPWSAIIDSTLHDNIAFTDQVAKKCYIDSKRLLNAPHSFANVITHEVGHLKGAQHGDGSLGMAYMVTTNIAGDVIDDSYYLLAPSLAQSPWPTLAPLGK